MFLYDEAFRKFTSWLNLPPQFDSDDSVSDGTTTSATHNAIRLGMIWYIYKEAIQYLTIPPSLIWYRFWFIRNLYDNDEWLLNDSDSYDSDDNMIESATKQQDSKSWEDDFIFINTMQLNFNSLGNSSGFDDTSKCDMVQVLFWGIDLTLMDDLLNPIWFRFIRQRFGVWRSRWICYYSVGFWFMKKM